MMALLAGDSNTKRGFTDNDVTVNQPAAKPFTATMTTVYVCFCDGLFWGNAAHASRLPKAALNNSSGNELTTLGQSVRNS